jgi:hypothetical protein
MSALLDPKVVDRLAKLCGMFGSHHDGERAAAAAMADELVRKAGLTWYDVIRVPASTTTSSDWQRMAHWCRAHQSQFNTKELEFIRTMLSWRGAPSEKQRKWRIDLFVRAGGAR